MTRKPKFDPTSAPAWLTAQVDNGSVPSLLERMAATVPPESIDELWLFPTRRLSGTESTVIVLSRYTDETDRRRVETVHFKTTRNKRGEAQVETVLEDHAVAPADRLTRIIDGVLRRLGDDLSASPRAVRISGEKDRWTALMESISANVELEEAIERVRERAQIALRRASTEADALEEAEAALGSREEESDFEVDVEVELEDDQVDDRATGDDNR